MKKISKVILLLIVMVFTSTGSIIASEGNFLPMMDHGNFIGEDSKNEIENISLSVKEWTGVSLYIVTVDENSNASKEALEKDFEKLEIIDSVMLICYLPSGKIDIKTGENAKNIFTTETINAIKNDKALESYLKKSHDDALVHLSMLASNTILTSKGLPAINLNERDSSKDFIFYIGIGFLALLILFITPISPYKKLKKLSKGESAYTPHTTNGELLHGGIESDRKP